MSLSEQIVARARGWTGTRFHHQGRLKRCERHGGGVDCLGLLVGVAAELDLTHPDGTLLSALDERNYTHYPDTDRLKAKLRACLQEIAPDGIRPGDIVLFRVDGQPQHLAIVSDSDSGLGLIHAYAPARRVVEHALDGWWRERIDSAFRFAFPIT